jgi:hypothetical protein
MDTDSGAVTFIKNTKTQIVFEFCYLIATMILASACLWSIHIGYVTVNSPTRWYLYSLIGGFLGGWAFDAKWFYRVTARGKDTQYPWKWEANKIYWRILIPFISAIVAFSIYLAGISKIIPIVSINIGSGADAFAFSFVMGYFSDTVIGKLAGVSHSLLGGEKSK